MEQTKKQFGTWGENVAAWWLLKLGYAILTKNFRTERGEIDLVVRQGDTLSFIEVKTRRGQLGTAERATNHTKVRRIKSIARYYCQKYQISVEQTAIQFEHVSIYLNPITKRVRCTKYILPVI
jgi:putative endonuclease